MLWSVGQGTVYAKQISSSCRAPEKRDFGGAPTSRASQFGRHQQAAEAQFHHAALRDENNAPRSLGGRWKGDLIDGRLEPRG